MKALFNFIFRRLPILKQLDGHKTNIGAGLTVLVGLLEILSKLALAYPNALWLTDGAVMLSTAISQINELLTALGFGFMTVGLMDKKIKKDL